MNDYCDICEFEFGQLSIIVAFPYVSDGIVVTATLCRTCYNAVEAKEGDINTVTKEYRARKKEEERLLW